MEKPALDNEFYSLYRTYTSGTESPLLFHYWAAVAGVSAVLGRRCFFDLGIGNVYPNTFVVLVGPPATRKGAAMDLMGNRLRAATSVRFAPTDTAGKKQGLIARMASEDTLAAKEKDDINIALSLSTDNMIDAMGELHLFDKPPRAREDRHCLFAEASEFTTLTGVGNTEILTFLQEMYDGRDYEYQLKNDELTLHEPLMAMLACTTPTYLADALPAVAIGQGFMSRIILVYQSKKENDVIWPEKRDPAIQKELDRILSLMQKQLHGEFIFDGEAKTRMEKAHNIDLEISDHRLIYYTERRFTHLIKVCMCMAAGELRTTIIERDVINAHGLLRYAEQYMTDALGEFGMSPLAKAKQKLMEFLESADQPITSETLWTIMHRDMLQRDFGSTLSDLHNAGRIKIVHVGLKLAYIATRTEINEDELLKELGENS